MMTINKLLTKTVNLNASDLHLRSGQPPKVRIYGKLRNLDVSGIKTKNNNCEFLYDILSKEKQIIFKENKELDFAYEVPNIGRFRVNFLESIDGLGAVFRVITKEIKTLEELRLPKTLLEFANLDKGLVLVTGPTGCGKTTTLASLIDYINNTRDCHIITIEDPVEFVHENKKCLITHREVGTHTNSFASALRAALREDPDIILVGEMRDLETVQMALTAAETGHLIFSTLHTNDAASTVDRLVDVFPSHHQNQIRMMLSQVLQGVVSQQLLNLKDTDGLIAALEIMFCNSAISSLIREGKSHQIFSSIQTGRKEGMQTMDQSITDLLKQHLIGFDEGFRHAMDKEVFQKFRDVL